VKERRSGWSLVCGREGRRLPPLFVLVRPAGRTHLEVKVLYTPGKGKC
jgi:hypothetical protein